MYIPKSLYLIVVAKRGREGERRGKKRRKKEKKRKEKKGKENIYLFLTPRK